jgi:ubiquinone/menaquinone biosynthesis C-methylase UbiE
MAMRWTLDEIGTLMPLVERLAVDIGPLENRDILVLCSAAGDLAFWLGKKMKAGKVKGLELDEELLGLARERARTEDIGRVVSFEKANKKRIPFQAESFDAVVSEFVVFPTPKPTMIGQRKMARVLRHGGGMALTDIIVTRPISNALRRDLKKIGLDYVCDATMDDFREWMTNAGLVDVKVFDQTPAVRKVWENGRAASPPELDTGYKVLLDDPELRLGRSLFYIYARGRKP